MGIGYALCDPSARSPPASLAEPDAVAGSPTSLTYPAGQQPVFQPLPGRLDVRLHLALGSVPEHGDLGWIVVLQGVEQEGLPLGRRHLAHQGQESVPRLLRFQLLPCLRPFHVRDQVAHRECFLIPQKLAPPLLLVPPGHLLRHGLLGSRFQ